jgi:hypothetical protein
MASVSRAFVEGAALMRGRVLVEIVDSSGDLQTREVFADVISNDNLSARTLGLSLEQAKEIVAALERHVILG